jgi:pyridoxal phosphate enzyme (YggS family)
MQKSQISESLLRTIDKIHAAAKSVGRSAEQIRLVVVTKGHPVEIVNQAVEAGVKDIGENYVEESLPKMDALGQMSDLEWHMIGHIQSRKARKVCENFNWVQSMDSLHLANRLNRFAGDLGKQIPVLLECNVSGEESKFGLAAWNEIEWSELTNVVGPILELSNLNVLGLMTMPPFFSDPDQARPYFIRLRKLRDYFAAIFPDNNWSELSMGMSADYVVAIQEGATIVRIGTAILGPREQRKGGD